MKLADKEMSEWQASNPETLPGKDFCDKHSLRVRNPGIVKRAFLRNKVIESTKWWTSRGGQLGGGRRIEAGLCGLSKHGKGMG